MPDSTRFELNNPPVIAEMVEGEVIAINLVTGSYYSLLGPAAEIWGLLIEGYTSAEILEGVGDTGSRDPLTASLERFVAELSAEELIRPMKGARASRPEKGLAPWPSDALRIERFSDMRDMLVLDPIHEIDDEVGWPRPAG